MHALLRRAYGLLKIILLLNAIWIAGKKLYGNDEALATQMIDLIYYSIVAVVFLVALAIAVVAVVVVLRIDGDCTVRVYDMLCGD